jgi:signal transduction histidine kinase
MSFAQNLARLLREVSSQQEPIRALNIISEHALTFTNSRHVLFAIVDDESGTLVVRAGAGDEYKSVAQGEVLHMDVGEAQGIVGYVAATGDALSTGDVQSESRYRRMFASTVSELAVPIRDSHGRIRAVLNLESDQPDAFGEDQMAIAEGLADLSAMVLEFRAHERREAALIEIGDALHQALTEEALIARVIQVAEETLRFAACSIFLLDRGTNVFVLRGSTGQLRDRIGEISYSPGEGLTGWVASHNEPILLNEPQTDPRWKGKYLELPDSEIASFLAVPIVARKSVIGIIRVLRRRSENPYLDNWLTLDDLLLLETMADQVATGLENIRNFERIIRSERMIAWGELSAKSSHMIGNRVFALKGDVNELKHLLAERALDLGALQEIQTNLSSNVLRIEEILQDFRDFLTATQISTGPTDLNALLQETAVEVFPRRSVISVQWNLDEGLPPVVADGKKLRRAIAELMENSTHYMESGGQLTVSTSVKQAHGRRVAQIEIADEGPGVPENRKGLIFQPFFSGRVKGMGLGLSIVKGIVDAHGGDVFEAGEEGSGAKFVIQLPVADRP